MPLTLKDALDGPYRCREANWRKAFRIAVSALGMFILGVWILIGFFAVMAGEEALHELLH